MIAVMAAAIQADVHTVCIADKDFGSRFKVDGLYAASCRHA